MKIKSQIKDASSKWIEKNRSLVLRQTPVWAQSFAVLLLSLGSLAIAAGFLFRIDEVVTVGGQLESIKGNTEVKSPIGGKVYAVFFKDGQLVEKGQLLVKFDTRQAAADKLTYTNLIQLEKESIGSRLQILKEKISVLNKKINTAEYMTNEMAKLVQTGGFQRFQYLQQLDSLYEYNSQLSSLQEEKNSMVLESNKTLKQLQNKLDTANLTLQYQNISAPVSGIIFDPKARAEGVLAAGAPILTIVPQEGLKAQIYVPNKDIGFVKPGQKAQVRVDAFPFTRYGELTGTVSQIGADALPPDEKANFYRFPVKLKLNRSFLQTKDLKVPLRSGMSITANLQLRQKRLISIFSDLLVDQTESIKSLRQQ